DVGEGVVVVVVVFLRERVRPVWVRPDAEALRGYPADRLEMRLGGCEDRVRRGRDTAEVVGRRQLRALHRDLAVAADRAFRDRAGPPPREQGDGVLSRGGAPPV